MELNLDLINIKDTIKGVHIVGTNSISYFYKENNFSNIKYSFFPINDTKDFRDYFDIFCNHIFNKIFILNNFPPIYQHIKVCPIFLSDKHDDDNCFLACKIASIIFYAHVSESSFKSLSTDEILNKTIDFNFLSKYVNFNGFKYLYYNYSDVYTYFYAYGNFKKYLKTDLIKIR